MAFTDPGTHELLKASVHGVLGSVAAICGGYNAIAFSRRGEVHLAVNIIVYVAVVAYELKKILRHYGR